MFNPQILLNFGIAEPFDAQVKDDRIYGRGASDDKGSMLIPIISFEALLASNGSIPVNVKFFFEGQEEILSPQLPEFVAKNKDLFTCDMLFSADGLQWSGRRNMMVMGLKGLVGIEIELQGPKRGSTFWFAWRCHPKPNNGIKSPHRFNEKVKGKITIDGFYDDVIELFEEEKKKLQLYLMTRMNIK